MAVSPKKSSENQKSTLQICQENAKTFFAAVIVMVVILLFATAGLPSKSMSSFYYNRDSTHHSSLRSELSSSPWFVNGPKDEFTPKLVWLMSYPNSGTSFTMMSVLRSSNFSTATNYGDEVTKHGDNSLSIYSRHLEGPYWLGLSGKLGEPRPLPSNYILTKTHCGSRCVRCPPNEYVETLETFMDACRKTSGYMPPLQEKQEFFYPTTRVHKTIHLIRNPLHNMVARFHLDIKNKQQKNDKEWLNEHPNNNVGFQKWCEELDELYRNEEYQVFRVAILSELKLTPCHTEVFKYTQWHNMVFEVIETLNVPSLLVHYEDYEGESFESTFQSILDFLELPRVSDPKHEFAPSSYDDYLTNQEKGQIRHLMKLLASPKTWNEVERYFA